MKRFRKWLEKRHKQKYCFHHDTGGNPANSHRAESWIEQRMIDLGRRKIFWCTKCLKSWII